MLDPFAGSCVTGEAAEELRRRWIGIEIERTYVEGARVRFAAPVSPVAGDEASVGLSRTALPRRGARNRSACVSPAR